ncbi:hypothetical protein H5410_001677 [Solanum commersonii]|uniref:Uncharacterized protein n=1 Tax=Solanum commersonii TaxID=4109 RepID=A0A9J6AZP8_SOLCO|nr:hypothetical protein H5410_001677 [Solanum commersonii]
MGFLTLVRVSFLLNNLPRIKSVSLEHRFAALSTTSAFCLKIYVAEDYLAHIQPLRVLNHWAIWYCFAKLLGNALSAHCHRRLDLLLQDSTHWNIRRDLGPFGDSPNGLADPQEVFSPFFQPFCSFLVGSVHALSLNPNT